MMSIGFESEEIVLKTLRERLRRMPDEELLLKGILRKSLEETRAEWKRRKKQ
jgi:hypothetical protein